MICEHLDREVRGGLIPADGQGRDRVLVAQALADDITDAAFALLLEQRRPASEQSAHSVERWRSAILRGVAAIAISGTGDEPADLGEIATAVAIDYLVPPARHRLARCRPCHRGVECGGNAMARDGRDRNAQGVTRMQTLDMWMAWAALAGADIPGWRCSTVAPRQHHAHRRPSSAPDRRAAASALSRLRPSQSEERQLAPSL